ncbi:hypothetical protein AB6A40_008118 [Gnathostoma spinigerum]|uniref:[histone H3]-lysine(27) N-trimethyltransferase n=1 Tax=Gnathostoma spinigerum TaxID=75299 RepID=A0ABD6EVW9_9BILA
MNFALPEVFRILMSTSIEKKRKRRRTCNKASEQLEYSVLKSSAGVVVDSSDDEIEWHKDWVERPVPQSIMDCVLSSYKEIVNEYKKMINTDGQKMWLNMMKNRSQRNYKVIGKKAKQLEFDPPEDAPSWFSIRSTLNSVLQKCPIRTFPNISAQPRMQYWTLAETNVMCEDERTLSHIPFIEDDDDAKFGEELLKTYEEGIHGTKVGCGGFMNDHILYRLMKKILERFRNEDKELLYRAIYEQFPNKASVRQLPFLYNDLVARFEPSSTDSAGALTANLSDDRALHSFQLLCCRRCFNYDCLLHGVSTDELIQRRRRGQATGEPCGESCYMHLKETGNSDEKIGDSRPINVTLKVEITPETWTPQEEAMFSVLRRTFKNDFCKIAKCLNVISGSSHKNCRELYAYSLRSAPISPRIDLSPTSPKRKRNHKDPHKTFRAVKWAKTEGKVQNSHVYKPCSHSGPCSAESDCYCVSMDNLCTKYCACGEQCKYRFPGCRCGPGLCRTNQCQCFFASWECDPDTCKSCRCDNLDDPKGVTCRNVAIQRGLQKRLTVAKSQVAGWGCFAAEDISKNEFISEYCGEVITHDESERRGKIYDKMKCSYLFGMLLYI